jgi:hypothetical protein
VEFGGFPEIPAPFLKERRTRDAVQSCVQEIRGISLAFREMWDTAGLPLKPGAGQQIRAEIKAVFAVLRMDRAG